jgi:DNA-binding Lrp family transcriptional regulator
MREYARVLGIARGTVQTRVSRLERRGVIRDHAPEISPQALGFRVLAYVHLHVAQGHLDSVTEALVRIPEVTEAHTIAGEGDVVCRVATLDTGHLEKVVQGLLGIPGIVRTRSEVILGERVPRRVAPLLDVLEREGDGAS